MHDRHSQYELSADCAAVRGAVVDVVAGEADAATEARVMAHTRRCTGCRFALDTARAYRQAMRRVGDAERAPQELRERIRGLLQP